MGENAERLGPQFRHALLSRGITTAELSGSVRRGDLVAVARGVVAGGEVFRALTPERQHLIRAEAVCGNQRSVAVASHVSAALLHGMSVWNIPLSRVHLTKECSARRRADPHLKVHTHRLDTAEIVVVDGISVTGAARTVLDVATVVPFEEAVVVADSALNLRRTTPEELRAGLAAFVGRHGRRRAEAVVDFANGLAEKPGESRSRVLFWTAGLPMPTLQHEFRRADGSLYARSDFWWEEAGLAGEFDGLIKYGGQFGDPSSVIVDEKFREDELRRRPEVRGVERWVWADLERPGSARLIARLRRRLVGC